MYQLPVWREVFLEVALRAIKKVHLSHTPWRLKKYEIDKEELRALNEGEAIFLALETTIASEISNEFIYSSFTNGMNIGDKNAKPDLVKPYPRYYEILREVSFNNVNDGKLFYKLRPSREQLKNLKSTSYNDETPDQQSNVVDLIVRRWEKYDEGLTGPEYKQPALIELKRYNKYEFSISEGTVKKTLRHKC